eukprot:6460165-Amphidinium_carterae.1
MHSKSFISKSSGRRSLDSCIAHTSACISSIILHKKARCPEPLRPCPADLDSNSSPRDNALKETMRTVEMMSGEITARYAVRSSLSCTHGRSVMTFCCLPSPFIGTTSPEASGAGGKDAFPSTK